MSRADVKSPNREEGAFGGNPCLEKHPHVRGEDIMKSCALYSLEETPPRAWGRPAKNRIYYTTHRNTPTCVGKTLSLSADVSLS